MSDNSSGKRSAFSPENAPFKLDAEGYLQRKLRSVLNYRDGMNFMLDLETMYGHQIPAMTHIEKSFTHLQPQDQGEATKRLQRAYRGGGLLAIAAFMESDLKGSSLIASVLDKLPDTNLPSRSEAQDVTFAAENEQRKLVTPIMCMFPETTNLMDGYSRLVERANHPSTGPLGAAAVHITVSQIYQAYDRYMSDGIAQLLHNGLDT